MAGRATERLPERRLNELLRQLDWRFLLAGARRPTVLDLGSGVDPEALALIADPSGGEPADLALTGFPSRRRLREAAGLLGPGGEIVCLWRLPRPGGAARARRLLGAAGFEHPRVYWPGPSARRLPQFWLPIESAPARARLLASRPPAGAAQGALRVLWRLAARLGMLAPACAVARAPGGDADPTAIGDPSEDPILLSGGGRSINKVVGIDPAPSSHPTAVAKFARVPAADEALAREATALRRVERDHPELKGVPRVLGEGRRVGCGALIESAVAGEPLIGSLAAESYVDLGERVASWLVGLGGGTATPDWRRRLLAAPLERFEREFGDAAPDVASRCRELVVGLGDLPPACEHRDCSPWNVLLAADGSLGLLDWESAEPDGLPALDLVYFLANAAFVLDGALETGATRPVYADLLDPASERGNAFAGCTAEYCSRLGIPSSELPRLRLLCWIVHSHSDYLHLEMAAAGRPSPEALRASAFLGLLEEELAHMPGS